MFCPAYSGTAKRALFGSLLLHYYWITVTKFIDKGSKMCLPQHSQQVLRMQADHLPRIPAIIVKSPCAFIWEASLGVLVHVLLHSICKFRRSIPPV